LALFLILAGALALLVTNRVPPDGVGLMVVVVLILTGEASPAQAFAGFAHPATLTVASLLILSAGVQRTGVTDGLVLWLRRHARTGERRFLLLQSTAVAPISAFISNTATVAMFLPVVMGVARDRGFSASRLLIPLSYASLLGGMCTLIGTSTNIVVSTLVGDHGLEPMGMFDFVPLGLLVAGGGFAYLTLISPFLAPSRPEAQDLSEAYHLRRFLTEVEIEPGSHLAGRTLEKSGLSDQYDLDVLEIHRGNMILSPSAVLQLLEHDVLLVHAPLEQIRRIQETEGVRLRTEVKVGVGDLVAGGMVLAEAVVPPGSPLENRTLKRADFRNRYGVTTLALNHHREVIRERVGRVPLHIGDVLLLYGSKSRMRQLAGFPELLSLVQILPPRPRRHRGGRSLLVLGITIAAAASGLVSLVTAAVAGATLMVLSGCLSMRELYRAIDRRTILLLAGMISLGLSMERSGAADYLARHLMEDVGALGPRGLLVVTFVSTLLLTEILTNNACAVIMTPLVIVTAQDFGLDPRPYAFAVAYAASASFLTPWGYQTNMFVYGPGGYRLVDFLRMGLPLTLIVAVVVCVFLPYFWPLAPLP
jgi:di/tricarboxylate transporter